MARDFDNVIGGPADFQLGSGSAAQSFGHTAGGIALNINPNNRNVQVDEFGVGVCNIRHMGDEVRCTVPFAEWVQGVLAEIYNPGRDQLSISSAPYLGIGRTAGYLYTTKEANIIPYASVDVAKKAVFWRVTPVGELELAFNNDDDRIFETEFACLVDEAKTDGELIGKLQLSA